MTSPLHIETTGAGVPVVLLHSSGLSGRQWRRLVPLLVKAGFRAIVPDLSGQGASEPWPEPKPLALGIDVDCIATLLRENGPAHVIGHSYGALVGLHAALAAPEAVRSLVLYEPVAFGVLEAAEDADARETLSRVSLAWGTTPQEHTAWLERFVDYWSGQGAWRGLREEARVEFERVGWAVHAGVQSLMDDQARLSTFALLSIPTHLFTAEKSPIAAQRVVQRLGQAIVGARVTRIPAVGHMGPLANGDLVNPLLLAALSG